MNIHSVVIGCTRADCTVMEIGQNMRKKSGKKNWGNPNGNQEAFSSSLTKWELFSFANVLISFERKHGRSQHFIVGSKVRHFTRTKKRLQPLWEGFCYDLQTTILKGNIATAETSLTCFFFLLQWCWIFFKVLSLSLLMFLTVWLK